MSPPSVTYAAKYASVGKRFFAFFIDSLCILFLYLILGFILGMQHIFDWISSLPLLGLWWFAGMLLVSWLYYATLESSSLQATIGKRLFNLRVVNQKGEKIGFIRATIRHFGKYLSRFTFCIGFLLVFFTKKKQTLHDKIAATLIVEI